MSASKQYEVDYLAWSTELGGTKDQPGTWEGRDRTIPLFGKGVVVGDSHLVLPDGKVVDAELARAKGKSISAIAHVPVPPKKVASLLGVLGAIEAGARQLTESQRHIVADVVGYPL